ncbi:MAG: molybdate ABC transporter substrate-binding protein [Chlorogloeopsis fritschii C42_A2020_084]|uniref:molybdate ABC transporter substrate-binding protein n=1 Tax=Chlorogloeopsis fritschii TaxID=1124 RepID=UPI001A002444|nr:molybdate ABC transporter substrate-binding protein [Chlorogloeopsis fritschii]MBF2005466.1 molybdate ABC transporter substrate-binding protein [Chlorogloeopsis fritschii C42_A2020_084]
MNRRQLFAFIGIALSSLILTVSLPFIAPSVVAQSNSELLVSAAASLKDAMEEIKSIYQQSKPNINIKYNFGASGALLQQVQQGAPVDVFISAANKQMDTLEQSGQLLAITRSILAKNRLVLIVPNNVTGVSSFNNLQDPKIKKIAIGEPRSVPAGQYAEQVLQKLGIYQQIKPKFVYANNVRQVLAAVESGNADAGLVYITDAKISDKIKVVATADEKYHSPIIYPVGVLKRSKNTQVAQDFVKFLSSDRAKSVLKKYGFVLP